MSRFRLTRRAENDVAEIYSYISRDNASAAERLVSDLFDLFQSLGRNPEIGQKRPDLRPDLRSISHGNYVVFYFATKSAAEIVAVIHGARDIEQLFRGKPS